MATLRVLHYLNQFFGQIGGETEADAPLQIRPGPVGPGQLLQAALGASAEVVATLVGGDNYVAADVERARAEAVELARAWRPDAVVAGPAFASGRYGIACATVGEALGAALGIPAVTAMHPESPGVELGRRHAYIVPAGTTARGMEDAVGRMAGLVMKLLRGEPVTPETDGYVPRGILVNELAEASAARRGVDMLLAKLGGAPYASEIPRPRWDRVPPPSPLKDPASATIALVSEGGIVLRGNPDRLESWGATKYLKYPTGPAADLTSDAYECIHGGFDVSFACADPDRIVPLDAARSLERDGRIGRLFPFWFCTMGNNTTIENARRFGAGIARELREGGADGVILTAT
jgi:glycine reductase